MTFASRELSFTIQLGKGPFGNSGFNTQEISGLRATANIDSSGLPGLWTAQLAIWGLPLSLMNQLSTLGSPPLWQRDNIVTVKAGNAGSAMTVVFQGNIQEAWADFNSAPEVSFNIQANPALKQSQQPLPPFSYKGSIDVATILSGIATQMGVGFENTGVSVILSNPYFPGTGREQVNRAVEAANIYSTWDSSRGTPVLAIWPKSGARKGMAPLISASTGMVGYPAYSGAAVVVRTEFNPNLTFGGQMNIQSIISPACGFWNIFKLTHNLSSLVLDDAPWFTEATGYRFGNSQMFSS